MRLQGIYTFEDLKISDMRKLTALKMLFPDKIAVEIDGDKKVVVVLRG